MSAPKPIKRRIKLIKPGLQLRLTLVLVGFAGMALMLQGLLFMGSMSRMALTLPNDGPLVMESMMNSLWRSFGLTVAFSLPAVLAVGILATFRFAGPIYRLENYLRSIIAGEKPRDCKLRKGDELHEFCDLLNEATRPIRVGSREESGDQGAPERAPDRLPDRIAG